AWAALRQRRPSARERVGGTLPSKALMLRQIGNTLPGAYRYRAAADLAAEVEWAKNRRITPERYRASLDGHEPPIPPDLILRVYREYERRKAGERLGGFEDLREGAVALVESEEQAG